MKRLEDLSTNTNLVIDTELDLKFCSMKYLREKNMMNLYVCGRERIESKEFAFFEVNFDVSENRIYNCTRLDLPNCPSGIVVSPFEAKTDYFLYTNQNLIYIDPERDTRTNLRLPQDLYFRQLFCKVMQEDSISALTLDNSIIRLDLNSGNGKAAQTYTPEQLVLEMVSCEYSEYANNFCLSFHDQNLAMYDSRVNKLQNRWETNRKMKNLAVSSDNYYLSCTDVDCESIFIYDLRLEENTFLIFKIFRKLNDLLIWHKYGKDNRIKQILWNKACKE